ncbi:hypothetical protein TBLA_0A04780 [Henningerozyma blattae CBS 6284]|uniref:Nucleotide exchange factor SIL1 n=1 Tax=Henningerozyma blattae (strain ATCC 34711 / CBS 6284 / DSM 70876 / NBRC 10599 / NRRL Y-10934 / UCD 77-7) TaxID=1071380 RepID=I2GVW9_HENB6|nr:hypothetical protein TBLA_0A04780 [Tetrapisispora blattae CBS 6284]CCH58271.1 hypothetical protein TBLA_0A04780 [Tetrapisispora blattae CBS 6284]
MKNILCILPLLALVCNADKIEVKPQPTEEDPQTSLYIGDSLICNSVGCYPKVFEPSDDWKVVKPAQQLPAGLDIRINLDTGLKEAKLGDKKTRTTVETTSVENAIETLIESSIENSIESTITTETLQSVSTENIETNTLDTVTATLISVDKGNIDESSETLESTSSESTASITTKESTPASASALETTSLETTSLETTSLETTSLETTSLETTSLETASLESTTSTTIAGFVASESTLDSTVSTSVTSTLESTIAETIASISTLESASSPSVETANSVAPDSASSTALEETTSLTSVESASSVTLGDSSSSVLETASSVTLESTISSTVETASFSSSEPPVSSTDSSLSITDASTEYEFSQQFNQIRQLLKQNSIDDYNKAETLLDDLIEYSHDYKYGFSIITHEFVLLKDTMLNPSYPVSLREVTSRIIIGCLRNNPPVIEYIITNYPTFKDEIFQWFQGLKIQNKVKIISSQDILIKRYMSILDELLPIDYDFSDKDLQSFSFTYDLLDNKNTKLKMLELVSNLFSNEVELRNHADITISQKWCNEYSTFIQDSTIDELHLRKFFRSLSTIKKVYGSQLNLNSSFTKWLSKQADTRNKRLNNGLKERDLEQDSFDKLFVESRHVLFGNPFAQRVKQQQLQETEPQDRFEDEF